MTDPSTSIRNLAEHIARSVRDGSLCLCGKAVCDGTATLEAMLNRHLERKDS